MKRLLVTFQHFYKLKLYLLVLRKTRLVSLGSSAHSYSMSPSDCSCSGISTSSNSTKRADLAALAADLSLIVESVLLTAIIAWSELGVSIVPAGSVLMMAEVA
jgi:hypothetical protein